MSNVKEVKELLSGISSKDVEDILNEKDEGKLKYYEMQCKKHHEHTPRHQYYKIKLFEYEFASDIICKWTLEDVRKFAKEGNHGTEKYGLKIDSIGYFTGDLPVKIEKIVDKLINRNDFYNGIIEVIADSNHFAPHIDPYLVYHLRDFYYLFAKWGKDIEIVEKEHMSLFRRWFG